MSQYFCHRLSMIPKSRLLDSNLLRLYASHLAVFRRFLHTNLFSVPHAVKQNTQARSVCSKLKFCMMYCHSTEHTSVQETSSSSVHNEWVLLIARQMRERASECDKMALSVPLKTISESLRILIDNGFSEDECLCLANDPVIIKNLSNFTNICLVLMRYGLQAVTVTGMVRKVPGLVNLNELQLIAKCESLRNLGFTDGILESVIAKAPDILVSDLKNIVAKVKFLNSFFKTSDVVALFDKFPSLFPESFEEIERKLMYGNTKLDATNRQMLNSNFFQHSLIHIETRHMFVVRTGFFRIVKKKKGRIDTNPLLREVLDTSDEEFVKMFGKIPLKDYRTFQKLLKKEKQLDMTDADLTLETDNGKWEDSV